MRKTFLTFCMAAFALLVVSSCGKLEDGLNKLKGEVADLKERVDKLEADLNKEVTAINNTLGNLQAKDQELASSINNLADLLDEKEEEISDAIEGIVATLNGLDSKYVGKSTYEAALQEIQNEKSALKTQLENLATLLGNTNVADMKAELLAEIAKVASSVAVTGVTKNDDGTYTLTFANGETLTAAAADANANNTGLVTVVDGEWHVVKEDGTTEPINVPLGVEDLKFKVDPETSELLYSVNGGDYEPTGAVVTEYYNTLVTGFYEDEDYVYVSFGGVEYTLVKAFEAASNLLAGKTYFTAEQTKVVKFEVTDVKSGFVAVTPKGWTAELDFAEQTLTVTAPAEGAGAESGAIEVWFLSNDGIIVNSTLQVVLGPAVIDITVDPQSNAVSMTFNQIEGETPEVVYGAVLASEFTDEYIEELLANLLWAEDFGAFSNNDPGNPDIAALRKTSFTGNMSDLVADLDYTKEYIVWAIQPVWEYNSDTYRYVAVNDPSDFIKVYHKMNAMNFSVEPSLTDAEFTIELLDEKAEGFYGFYLNPWFAEVIMNGLEDGTYTVTNLLTGMFGTEVPLKEYKENTVTETLQYFGVSDQMLEYGFCNQITPFSTSVIGIIPCYADKWPYSYEDIIFKEVSTKEVVLGSEKTVTFVSEEAAYTTVTLTYDAPDANYIMYEVYGPDDFPVPATDEDVIKVMGEYMVPDVFDDNSYEGTLELTHDASFGEVPGTAYTFIIVFIDADGKAKIERKTVTTKELPTNDALSLEVDAYIDELDNLPKAEFTITGDAAKLYYTSNTANPTSVWFDPSSYQIQAYEETLDWNVVDLTAAELVEGTYVASGFDVVSNDYKAQNNYVHAILVDAEGKVSAVYSSASYVVPKGYVNQ